MEAKTDRVRAKSPLKANMKIDRVILDNITYYQNNPHLIDERIRQLDEEWDVDRALMLNFAVVAGTGLVLAALRNKWWLLLPVIQIPFLAYHAVKGWCPPAPVFRHLKFRTRQEIDHEKFALKYIRGDFDRTGNNSVNPDKLFEMTNHEAGIRVL